MNIFLFCLFFFLCVSEDESSESNNNNFVNNEFIFLKYKLLIFTYEIVLIDEKKNC